MLGAESSTILRMAVFSGFVGFFVFCASYATHVWLKRNNGTTIRSPLKRASFALAAVGLIGLGMSWAANLLSDRNGIVDANALFVVHARRDGNVQLTAGERVKVGDLVAEFHPVGFDAQQAISESQINEARARVEMIRARPLEADPVLLQEQNHLHAERGRLEQFQLEYTRARDELARSKAEAVANWGKEHNSITSEISTTQSDLLAIRPQLGVAGDQVDRARELRKQALASAQVEDERLLTLLALNEKRSRLETLIAGLTARVSLVDEQHARGAAVFDAQLETLAQNAATTTQALADIEVKARALNNRFSDDRARAFTLQRREIGVAERQVETLIAERNRAIAAQRIIAPFAGTVKYRNNSPDLVQDNGPILAVAAGTGFEARISLPTSEVKSVATAGTVRFAVEHPVLTRYFSGTFHAANEMPSEAGRSIATFDAQLPQEVIENLGNGQNSVKVRLLWHPPLLDDVRFRGSLIILLAAVLLMALDDSLRTFKPQAPTTVPTDGTDSTAGEGTHEGEPIILHLPVIDHHHRRA